MVEVTVEMTMGKDILRGRLCHLTKAASFSLRNPTTLAKAILSFVIGAVHKKNVLWYVPANSLTRLTKRHTPFVNVNYISASKYTTPAKSSAGNSNQSQPFARSRQDITRNCLNAVKPAEPPIFFLPNSFEKQPRITK